MEEIIYFANRLYDSIVDARDIDLGVEIDLWDIL